jgi:hypothetical protein
VENDLLTNKKNSALLRDEEKLVVTEGRNTIIDLRPIPKSEWDHWLNYDVTAPPAIARYLHGRDSALNKDEVHAIEIATEKFHGVTDPYFITVSPTLQSRGRPWAYIEAAGKFLTGLTFGKK